MKTRILKYRRFVIVVSQTCLLAIAYYCSFLLRFDFQIPPPFVAAFLRTLPLALSAKLLALWYFGLFRGWWRYVGMSDLKDIMSAAAASAPVIYLAVRITHGLVGYPRSVIIIDFVLTILVIGGLRFAVRAYTESAHIHATHASTLIVGAGRAGSAIAREISNNPRLEYNLVGFVDDDPTKKGLVVQGFKVLGNVDDLPRIITRNDVAQILIAIPSATGKQIQRIIDKCRECQVQFKTLPEIGDLIDGSASIGRMRSIRVEDLLFREPVRLDLDRIREKFQGKVTLITGAGGSIGSELARQVAKFNPARLLLYDQSENDLHAVDLELCEHFPDLQYVPIVGDILDSIRLREIFAAYRPHSVFHAAAYKHVPMMEKNCFQAVTNNIFGTHSVALAAKRVGVEDFVLISTDKAVNPSSIMGVTKRVAELLVLALQNQSTRFVSVRFGNVLGSSGSVLPLFERQVAQRRPITVTHPEAKRYFMTIPEAVQLVLQASTMGKGGEIFVLDMGEPLKVVDLAKGLVKLSGLDPEKDIPLIYTGLRPGEKLFEELKLNGEGIKATWHEKIRVLDGGTVVLDQVDSWLSEISQLVQTRDLAGLIAKLTQIVPEYTPSEEIVALAGSVARNQPAPDCRSAVGASPD